MDRDFSWVFGDGVDLWEEREVLEWEFSFLFCRGDFDFDLDFDGFFFFWGVRVYEYSWIG